jgi:hypothetical protein
MTDEHDLSVVPCDAMPAVCDWADGESDLLTDSEPGQGFSSSATVRSACSADGSPRRTAPGPKFSGRSAANLDERSW